MYKKYVLKEDKHILYILLYNSFTFSLLHQTNLSKFIYNLTELKSKRQNNAKHKPNPILKIAFWKVQTLKQPKLRT